MLTIIEMNNFGLKLIQYTHTVYTKHRVYIHYTHTHSLHKTQGIHSLHTQFTQNTGSTFTTHTVYTVYCGATVLGLPSYTAGQQF